MLDRCPLTRGGAVRRWLRRGRRDPQPAQAQRPARCATAAIRCATDGTSCDPGGVDRVTLGARAEQLGHHVDVVRTGKRFRLVCSCGVASTARMKRMVAFDLITAHLTDVVRFGRPKCPECNGLLLDVREVQDHRVVGDCPRCGDAFDVTESACRPESVGGLL